MGKKLTSRRPRGTQSCVFCGKQLCNYTVLIEHINSHIGERPCRCVPCDLWFATGAVLCEHRRIVHEKKKVTCPFCGKQFNFSSNLSDHKRRVHFQQYQLLKQKREIQKTAGGTSLLIKKTAKPLRVVKNKTEKHSSVQAKASEEEIFFKEESLEEEKVSEESQEDEPWAEEEEEILEESEEETVYPHQVNNHEEYFRALNQQRLAVLSMIFKTFPPVKLNEDRFQVPKVEPFRPVPTTEVTATIAKNIVEVNNKKVSVQKPAPKIIQTSTSKECTVCGKYISRRSNLLQHLRNVHGVQLPVRRYTNKLIESREEEGLSDNKSSPPKSSGNQMKHKCYKCSLLFSHSNMLRKHITTKHPGCPVKINTTGGGQRRITAKSQQTGQKEPLKDSRRERERGLFKCAKCDGQYSWRFDLIRHTRRKHPELDVSSLEIVNMAAPNISSKPSKKKIKEEVAGEKKLVKIDQEIPDKVRTPRVTRRIYRSVISKQLDSKMNKIVFKCYKCSAQLPRIAAFKRHMSLMHANCPTKILVTNQELSSANDKNTSSMTGAFKCPECSTIFKWKKNLARHIRSVHNSVSKCGKVLKKHFNELLNPDQPKVDLGNAKNSAISSKKIVKKKRILGRSPKGTGSVAKSITDDSNCSKHDKYVSRISTNDISNSTDKLPTDKSPAVNTFNSGESGMFQCDNCGRCLGDKWKLARHLKFNGCLHAKRAALAKLDAFLDFICTVCKRQFKGNSYHTARYFMEYHLATVHRFHHEKAREYQHLKLRHAPPIYFCTFCGLNKSTASAIVKHLRSNHRSLLGVPKNIPNNITGSTDNSIDTDPNGSNGDRNKPLQSPEVPAATNPSVLSTNTTSVVNNFADTPATEKALTAESSSSGPQSRCQCVKCGRWFGDKWSLNRHVERNSCRYAERESLIKLDASLDFICPICSKEFKTNSGARCLLEYHIASGHRFDHENAREYRHLKLGQAPGIYFCAICGSREASRKGLADHLRTNHKELLGIPKKIVNVESSMDESQEAD